jgi:hypothetical protein
MRKAWWSIQWPIRLLVLCLVVGGFAVSASRERVKADGHDCQHDRDLCTYNCAWANWGDLSAYNACLSTCNSSYDTCAACDFNGFPDGCMDSVDNPEPYPVVADYTMCMDNCYSTCNWLPLGPERYACFSPCKVDCINNYAH